MTQAGLDPSLMPDARRGGAAPEGAAGGLATPINRRAIHLLRWATILSPEAWILLTLGLLLSLHGLTWMLGATPATQAKLNAGTGLANLFCTLLIIRSQRTLTTALQLKLGVLIAAMEGADNRLIDIEDASEEELEALRERLLRGKESAGPGEAIATHDQAEERSAAPGVRDP